MYVQETKRKRPDGPVWKRQPSRQARGWPVHFQAGEVVRRPCIATEFRNGLAKGDRLAAGWSHFLPSELGVTSIDPMDKGRVLRHQSSFEISRWEGVRLWPARCIGRDWIMESLAKTLVRYLKDQRNCKETFPGPGQRLGRAGE